MDSEINIARKLGDGHPKAIKVLIYHRVLDEPTVCDRHDDMCVSAPEFRMQLRLLERWGFTSITFHDYHLFLKGELNLPKKPVIITFDDGYKDVFTHAFPLLQEFGMKAVIFAIGSRTVSSNLWDKDSDLPPAELMSEHELLELHAAGHEIGSHSVNHVALPMLPKETMWDELSRSRMLLEILLNAPVHSFAYPYGLLNDQVKKLAAEAGYLSGCGVYTGPAQFGDDPFDIRRILIRGTTGRIGFALRLLTPFEYSGWLRWKIRTILKGPAQPMPKNAIATDAAEAML